MNNANLPLKLILKGMSNSFILFPPIQSIYVSRYKRYLFHSWHTTLIYTKNNEIPPYVESRWEPPLSGYVSIKDQELLEEKKEAKIAKKAQVTN